MEEIPIKTELIYAMIAVLAASIVGGIISWKLIDKKEEERSKECKMLGKEVWVSKIKWMAKMDVGIYLLFTPLIGLLFLRLMPLLLGFWMYPMFLGVSIFRTYHSLHKHPVFAITDNTIVCWKYFGFANRQKYTLHELYRMEYRDLWEQGAARVIALYQGKKPVLKIKLDDYENKKKLLELLKEAKEV